MLHQHNENSISMIVYLKTPILQRKFVTGRRHWLTDSSDRTTSNFAEARISITNSTACSPEYTALSPLVAPLTRSNESLLDSYNTVVTPMSFPDFGGLDLANPLLFGHPHLWDHPVSHFDKGIDNGPFTIHNYEPDVDVTQTQLAQSHLPLPQIDWASNEEPLLPYVNQATRPVSTIVYPQST